MSVVLRGLTAIMLAVAASGCLVSSLHPVYDEHSLLFDEVLVGRWENAESEISVAVARGEWRSYQIAFTDRFGTTRYTGHLTAVGTIRLLSVIPQTGLEQPPFVVATTGFMQIAVDAGRVRVREPDYAEVLSRAQAAKLGLDATTDLKQNVIITAPSARLRAWLTTAVKDEALWAEWKTFTRSAR
jgi:hypothetical protein